MIFKTVVGSRRADYFGAFLGASLTLACAALFSVAVFNCAVIFSNASFLSAESALPTVWMIFFLAVLAAFSMQKKMISFNLFVALVFMFLVLLIHEKHGDGAGVKKLKRVTAILQAVASAGSNDSARGGICPKLSDLVEDFGEARMRDPYSSTSEFVKVSYRERDANCLLVSRGPNGVFDGFELDFGKYMKARAIWLLIPRMLHADYLNGINNPQSGDVFVVIDNSNSNNNNRLSEQTAVDRP